MIQAVLIMIMAAGLPTPPSPHQQINQLERELAKEPIQKSALLPINSAQCAIYSPANITKVEKLVQLHAQARTLDFIAWREHLAWMYENCGKGVSHPRSPRDGATPRPEMLPQTRGLEQAFDLYKESLMSEKALQIALKIAEIYEQRYGETGDETLLHQARYWREQRNEQTESIRDLHRQLEWERIRKQPRRTPRPKIGRTGTEDFLRALFNSCVFGRFLVRYALKLGSICRASRIILLILQSWTCYSFRW